MGLSGSSTTNISFSNSSSKSYSYSGNIYSTVNTNAAYVSSKKNTQNNNVEEFNFDKKVKKVDESKIKDDLKKGDLTSLAQAYQQGLLTDEEVNDYVINNFKIAEKDLEVIKNDLSEGNTNSLAQAYQQGLLSEDEVNQIYADNYHIPKDLENQIISDLKDRDRSSLKQAVKDGLISEKEAKKYDKEYYDYHWYEKVGNFLKSTGATILNTGMSVVEGVVKWGEKANDTLRMTGAFVVGLVGDRITGQDLTYDIMQETKEEIKNNDTQELFDMAHEDTKVGKFIDENGVANEKVRSISNSVGEIGMTIAVSWAGGQALAGAGAAEGALTATNAAKTGRTISVITSGVEGFGGGMESAYQNGAELNDGLKYALASGTWNAAQFAVGGGVNNFTPFTSSLGNAALHVGIDSVLGASEGFVQPGLQKIYNHDDSYWELFDQNGGVKTVLTGAAMGGAMSALSESFGLAKAFREEKETIKGIVVEDSDIDLYKSMDDINAKYNAEIDAARPDYNSRLDAMSDAERSKYWEEYFNGSTKQPVDHVSGAIVDGKSADGLNLNGSQVDESAQLINAKQARDYDIRTGQASIDILDPNTRTTLKDFMDVDDSQLKDILTGMNGEELAYQLKNLDAAETERVLMALSGKETDELVGSLAEHISKGNIDSDVLNNLDPSIKLEVLERTDPNMVKNGDGWKMFNELEEQGKMSAPSEPKIENVTKTTSDVKNDITNGPETKPVEPVQTQKIDDPSKYAEKYQNLLDERDNLQKQLTDLGERRPNASQAEFDELKNKISKIDDEIESVGKSIATTSDFVYGSSGHMHSQAAIDRNLAISSSDEYKQLVDSVSEKGYTLSEYGGLKANDGSITKAEQTIADALASSKCSKAALSEPKITADLKSLESDSRHLTGLDFRLKGKGSMSRKIISDAQEMMAKDSSLSFQNAMKKAQSEVGDSVRYTMLCEPESMASDVRNTIEKLKKSGYEIRPGKFKNTYSSDVYRGINVGMQSPDGTWFELQFHTPQSFSVKEETNHLFYEISRNKVVTTEAEKKLADAIMRSETAKIVVPDDVLSLKLQ